MKTLSVRLGLAALLPLVFAGCVEPAHHSDDDDMEADDEGADDEGAGEDDADIDDGADRDQEPEEPADEEPESCVDLGDPCSSSGECCGFDYAGEVGDSVCVDFGTEISCTDFCYSNSDCASGCCGALEGESIGACAPAEFCEAAPDTGGGDDNACSECLSSCSGLGLPSCCTGVGCICEDECAPSPSDCPAGTTFCCGPYDCLCLENCPYG